MKNVYIVEIDGGWECSGYEIAAVFDTKEKAIEYGASYAVRHWSPDDDDGWQEEMEDSGKYISKFDYAKMLLKEADGDWFVRISEYELM